MHSISRVADTYVLTVSLQGSGDVALMKRSVKTHSPADMVALRDRKFLEAALKLRDDHVTSVESIFRKNLVLGVEPRRGKKDDLMFVARFLKEHRIKSAVICTSLPASRRPPLATPLVTACRLWPNVRKGAHR